MAARSSPTTGRATRCGYADQIEIIVINDATARTAALQGGQVNMINRVEPKIVDLIKRVPGVTIRNVAGRGHYVFIMHCNTAPFDNNDLRMALKLRHRPRGDAGQDPARLRLGRQRHPDQRSLSAVPRDSSSASTIRKRPPSTTRSRAMTARCCCAPPTSPSPARSTPPSSTSRARPRPASRSRSSASPATATGRKSGTSSPSRLSYWGGRPTQDQMYSTAYLSTADWNDTRFMRPDFDKMVLAARAELDEAKRKEMYRDMADDGARRRRPDPADVQPVHRRDRRRRSTAGSTIRTRR